MKSIEIRNLTLILSGKAILKQINIKLYAGHVIGLVGPNGSGKTSLLKTILGLYPTYKGEIIKSTLSYSGILEEPGFSPFLSGLENIKYLCENTSNLWEYINKFEMVNYIKDKVSTYSQGMRQRLALVTIFAQDKDILIFDEPLNALDIKAKKMFINIVNKKKSDNKIIVISSHIFEDLGIEFDNIILLHEGKVIDRELSLIQNRYTIKFKDSKDLLNFKSKCDHELEIINSVTAEVHLKLPPETFLDKYSKSGIVGFWRISMNQRYFEVLAGRSGNDEK